MEYTKLGSSDLNVSRICLGTMTWGKQNTQDDAFEQMNYALTQGVNFWDTAELYAVPPSPETYGKTETYIGNWFAQHGRRDEVILATKFSPIPWARGEEVPQTNKETLTTALDNSLKRLQTDYVDLYQLHWPTNRANYHFSNWWEYEAPRPEDKQAIIDNKLEILQTLDGFIKAGKIGYIGLSDDSAWGIKQFVDLAEQHNLPRMVSIQNEYSLICRRDDHDIAETCALENVAYLPWSPLAGGVLSGKYLDGARPEGARYSDLSQGRYNYRLTDATEQAVKAYIDVARKYGLDVTQMALAYTISKPWHTCTIIGATSMEQLKSNIGAIDVTLSKECLADIEAVYRKYPVPF